MSIDPGALRFLLFRSARNRLRQQVQRLREPRYAIGMAIALLYFGGVFILPLFLDDGPRPRQIPTPSEGLSMLSLASILLFALVAGSWIVRGGDRSLAFQPAEVGMLFPAPLSRQQLLLYRLGQSQVLILLNALLLALLSSRAQVSVPFVQRVLAAWLFVSVLQAHKVGLALLRVAPAPVWRQRALQIGRVVAVAALLVVVRTVMVAAGQSQGLRFPERIQIIRGALSEGLSGIIMAPFDWVLSPLWLTGTALVAPLVGGVLVLVVLLTWVLRSRVAFEEAAAVASVQQAELVARARKAQRGQGSLRDLARSRPRVRLRLLPTGPSWVALSWKNSLAMIRNRMYVPLLVMVASVAVIFAMGLGSVSERPGAATILVPLIAQGIVMALTVVGANALRSDLRADMTMLPLLKTFPISGDRLVFGQVLSPALTITLCQAVVLLLGALKARAGFTGEASPVYLVLGAVLGLGILLLVNLLALLIHSGSALLFPGWVHLGVDAIGIEAMGQRLLVGIGTTLALLLLSAVPLLGGAALFWALTAGTGLSSAVAVLAGAVVSLGLLALEVGLLVAWLGQRFERTDATVLS